MLCLVEPHFSVFCLCNCLAKGDVKMRIAFQYNHLNAREYLLVNKHEQFDELQSSITTLDANRYLKISLDKAKFGIVIYNQGQINSAIQEYLRTRGWAESKVYYYVTSDEPTTREIVHILDKEEQKRIIESRGQVSHSTYNQVDFQKDRIAVEVQFGKYFSVAYDLHVKHTFFKDYSCLFNKHYTMSIHNKSKAWI